MGRIFKGAGGKGRFLQSGERERSVCVDSEGLMMREVTEEGVGETSEPENEAVEMDKWQCDHGWNGGV